MKRIEFDGKVHEFPDDFSDADISGALGNGQPAQPADTRTGFRRWYDSIAQPVTRAVANGAQAYTLGQRGGPATREEYAPGPEAMEAAKLVVPQSPIAAGAMIGTGAMGGAAAGMGAKGGWAALSRILGGTVGGELGDISEGGSGAKGAALGGIPAAIGEGAVALGSKVVRSLPWVKGAIEARRAGNIGEALGEISEPLAGAKTTEDVYKLASGEGLTKLGAAKEKAVQQIEGMLPGAMYGPGPKSINVPSLGGGMPLRDANAELSRIGDMMAGRAPLDPRYKDANLSQLYGTVASEIRDGIEKGAGPGAARLWDTTQAIYRRGRSALEPYQQAGAFKGSADSLASGSGGPMEAGRMIADQRGGMGALAGAIPKTVLPNLSSRYSSGPMEGLTINAPGVQRWLVAPENRAELVRKLGPDGYERLVRGNWFERAPFSAPESIKTIIDMALQRTAGEAGR